MPTQATQRGDSHRLALSHFITESSTRVARHVRFLLFIVGSICDAIPHVAARNSVFLSRGLATAQIPSVASEKEKQY
jgi:hypothetical protein